jgi:hypothetical protein
MNPNANLAQQRHLARTILSASARDIAAIELAELVEALDDWIRKSGLLPAAWARGVVPDDDTAGKPGPAPIGVWPWEEVSEG